MRDPDVSRIGLGATPMERLLQAAGTGGAESVRIMHADLARDRLCGQRVIAGDHDNPDACGVTALPPFDRAASSLASRPRRSSAELAQRGDGPSVYLPLVDRRGQDNII